MPRTTTRILIVEDDDGDADIVAEHLQQMRGVEASWHRVRRLAEAMSVHTDYDVVLLDLELPDATNVEAIQALAPSACIIVLTILDARIAEEALQAGAQDFLIKDDLNPDLLRRSIQYALARQTVVRHRAEVQTQKEELLRQIHAVKQDFINEASHELQTPLTPLRVYVRRLRSLVSDLDQPELQRVVGKIEGDIERLGQLVDRFLMVTRLRTDRALGTACTDAENILVNVRAKCGAGAVLEAKGPLIVACDATALETMLLELLDNARALAAHVRVTACREGDQIVFEVEDDGPGFDGEEAARLFEVFSPDLRSTHGKARAGVGLAMVRRLADACGGLVEAHSRGRGQGARFRLSLPAA